MATITKRVSDVSTNVAGNIFKKVFVTNWRITLGLISMVMFANPSGFSYYHWTVVGKAITMDKLMALDWVAWICLALGAVMLFFASRVVIKSWEVLRSGFDKFWAFAVVALVTVLQFVFFKEQILQNMMNLSYVAFVDVATFCLYAIFTKRADFRDFKTRGVDVLHDYDGHEEGLDEIDGDEAIDDGDE